MGGKYTKAQKAATTKYLAEKTETITLRLPKGKKAVYIEYAKSRGISFTALVQELLDKEINKNS